MKKRKYKLTILKLAPLFSLAGLTVLFCFLLAYLFIGQRETNGAQELVKFPAFSISSYLKGDFQESFETAAKDQFFLHDKAIAWNADTNAAIKGFAKKSFSFLKGKGFKQELVPYGKVYRMYGSDWLMNLPYSYDEVTAKAYLRKAQEMNEFANAHANLKVYVYYCTRAEDLDWFDDAEGLKSYSWSEFLEHSLQPVIRFDKIKFRDFSEYQGRMYRTDHHWNNVGAAAGYADILRMMSQDYDMGMARGILRTEDYGKLSWVGSRVRESGKSVPQDAMDIFAINEYIVPEHITMFGNKKQDIGLKKVYDSGAVNREIGFDQYLNYYGFESNTITLKYNSGEHNLLIIGDSFTRAIREPLSSHFKNTVFVNFRILEQVNLEEILENSNIDSVLFMGQQDAWSGYFLNGKEETK